MQNQEFIKAKNLKIDAMRSKVTLDYGDGDVVDVPVPEFKMPIFVDQSVFETAILMWLEMAANAAHEYAASRRPPFELKGIS